MKLGQVLQLADEAGALSVNFTTQTTDGTPYRGWVEFSSSIRAQLFWETVARDCSEEVRWTGTIVGFNL